MSFFLTQIFILCFCAFSVAAKGNTTPGPEEQNTKPIVIDPKLRRALLQALSTLESENNSATEVGLDDTTETTTYDAEIEDTATPAIVKIHSFAVDGDNLSNGSSDEIFKTIIISKPRSTLEPPKDTDNNKIDNDDNRIRIKFSAPNPTDQLDLVQAQNIQLARSVITKEDNERKIEKPKKKATEKQEKFKPTTTTLPPPVTNSEGENIERVNEGDVKIFSAPLLAAFTVQQDRNGNANKITSLFRNQDQKFEAQSQRNNFKPSQPIASVTALPAQPITNPVQTSQAVQPASQVQQFSAQNQNAQQLKFEERQRQLEQQIYILQARQREQDNIIRQHQLLQEQQKRQQNLFNDQRFRFEEEQRLRLKNEQEQFFFRQNQQNQQNFQNNQNIQNNQNNQNNVALKPALQPLQAPVPNNVAIQFIPSIPLGHSVGISVEQQLPFKGPVEFNPQNPKFQRPANNFNGQLKPNNNQQQNTQQQNFNQQQNINQQNFNQQNINQQNAQDLRFKNNNQLQIQQQNLQLVPVPPQLQSNQSPPSRPFQNFQQQNFQPQQSINASPLPTNLELPQRQFQSFNSNPVLPSALELPLKPFQTFNSNPLTNLPSLTDVIPPTQTRPRVFRQDAGQTGNFGFNQNQNQNQQNFNNAQSAGQIDTQLQNLLLQSGISTRSAEDFRIISKVLALNHGGENDFFNSNNNNNNQGNNQGRFKRSLH